MASHLAIEAPAGYARFDPIGFGRHVARRSVGLLFVLSVLLVFLVSPMRLDAWGVPYDMPGGDVFSKVHPGAWAALLAAGLGALFVRAPRDAVDRFVAHRGLLAFFSAWLFLLATTVLFLDVPFTPLIDAFLLPMVYFFLFVAGLVRPDRRLARMLHVIMAANAALGIVEHVTGWRLTPYPFAMYDPRPTAFLGHPLANASMTGAYLLALAFGGGRDLPRPVLAAALLLQGLAAIAFGGRAAAILVACVLLVRLGFACVKFASGKRIERSTIALCLVCIPIVAAAAAIVVQSGFLDSFFQRFVTDRGSAEARVIMFRVLSEIPFRQILFGPDPNLLSSLQFEENIPAGIESFWISFALQYGLVVSCIFFLALLLFCLDVIRTCRPGSAVILAYFFIVASTSVSLSAKSCIFAELIVIVMVLMKDERSARVRSAPVPDA
jgi:hypothetical protein